MSVNNFVTMLYIINYICPRYNKLSREIRELANKVKDLDASTDFRTEVSAQLLEKLYQMGLIPTRWDLALASNISASSFCRRRLPVVMIRSKYKNIYLHFFINYVYNISKYIQVLLTQNYFR